MKHLKILGAVALVLALSACGGGSGCNNAFGSLANCGSSAAPNVAPVAVITGNKSVVPGAQVAVALDGSASTDANNDKLTYAWTVLSAPAGAGAVQPVSTSQFNLPTPVSGAYVVSLTVSDGKLTSTPAVVTVTASDENYAPVANAGATQYLTLGLGNPAPPLTVTLNGTLSSDQNVKDKLSYRWAWVSKPDAASAVNFDLDTSPVPKFVTNIAGDYVASLIVSDGILDSAIAYVRVSVVPPSVNSPPVAIAGPDQYKYVTPGTVLPLAVPVTLDGSKSADINGQTLTYKWTLNSPSGSQAVLSTQAPASASQPTFTADVMGTYVATLVVNDGIVDSQSVAQTRITVAETNMAPVAVPVATPASSATAVAKSPVSA